MKHYYRFLAVCILIGSGMALRADSAKRPDALQVEIMLFSGRPNPVFEVTDPKEIREILGLAKSLPAHAQQAERGPVARSGLGYRGIRVTNASGELAELASFDVFRSDVETNDDRGPKSKKEFRVDQQGALERRLVGLAQARGVIDAKLAEKISSAK